MADACRRRDTCRLCGHRHLTPVLQLQPTPPANAFVSAADRDRPQTCFPLQLFFCRDCHHVQLLDVVDPSVLFENYVYVSGTSPVLVRHFSDFADNLIDYRCRDETGLVIDIGSNDGTLLRHFKQRGFEVLGIDPARDIARQATESGIDTLNAFFDPDLAGTIRQRHGTATIITANNVFAHIDDLGAVTRGIKQLLSEDGLFAFEVSWLADVFEHTLFDTIYHEHLSYHSVEPLCRFFETQGLQLIEALPISPHGGSLRGIAQHRDGPREAGESVTTAIERERRLGLDKAETLQRFGTRIEHLRGQVCSLLEELKQQGHTIAAFGAPAKATTLMYHFGIGPDIIDFIADDNPLKQGLYSPGMHIPVLPATAIAERRPDYLVILAWNFAPSIIDKQRGFADRGGRFIVPLPELEIL